MKTVWKVLGKTYYQISLLNTGFLLQWCTILSFKYSNKMQILRGDTGIQLSVAKTGRCPRHSAWLCGQGRGRKWVWGRALHLSTQGLGYTAQDTGLKPEWDQQEETLEGGERSHNAREWTTWVCWQLFWCSKNDSSKHYARFPSAILEENIQNQFFLMWFWLRIKRALSTRLLFPVA